MVFRCFFDITSTKHRNTIKMHRNAFFWHFIEIASKYYRNTIENAATFRCFFDKPLKKHGNTIEMNQKAFFRHNIEILSKIWCCSMVFRFYFDSMSKKCISMVFQCFVDGISTLSWWYVEKASKYHRTTSNFLYIEIPLNLHWNFNDLSGIRQKIPQMNLNC